MQEVVAVVHCNPPGLEVTVYPLTAAPFAAGAVQDTTLWASVSAVADTPEGAPGTADGTTAEDGAEAALVPFAFVAVTVNVYEVPLVRPVTVQLVVAVVQVNPPGEEVTVYPVMAVPPLFDGAVHETTDWVLAAPVADAPVGTCETPSGMIAEEAEDAEPAPDTFVAVTLNVYETPPVRPVTVHEVVAVEQVNPPGDEVTV